MSLKSYETVFILTPVLSEPQMKDAVDKFKAVLKENGAEFVNEESWGLKKLAYPVQRKKTGFYNLIEFNAPADIVDKLEVEFRRDERILRFLTVSLDKYALEYSIKRRKGFKSSKPKTEKA